ncbi:MAG: GH32 C-terminal domain-containing protein [Muribaculaceae bacterium]|nr:GH32 C-terminal domain-containing protein [Muribaculaceae bacterium]
MKKHRSLFLALTAVASIAAHADLVAHFDMEAHDGMVTETVSGSKYAVEGNFAPENLPGAVGEALRFDGYTSHVKASLGNILTDSKTMTVSLWVATPSYPIIQIDTDTKEKTPIVTCLDKDNKSGFGFYLGFNGKYSFETFIGGWPLSVEADVPLPTYQWNNLVAVIDCDARTTKLYCNGVEVGSGKASGSISYAGGDFYMGQGTESRMAGPFQLMSFNGLIDDISVWNEAKSQEEIASWKPETEANLDIPASRFADQLLRPRFHGMPAAGWTNECHGMTFSDGRYHLFFQKNADGPYMARLHWGHISSENLYDWREEKIAIAPGDWYDIKGCWSGCIFTDDEITGGKPNAIYTAVDYVKAMIAQASPETDALDNWVKSAANPIINGRPAGLSDDFRDPYFFRNGDNAYIIVGSSKDGVGTTTLHRYEPSTKTWSNNGDQFFTGSNKATDGTFWEMPNVTLMPDGRWLFTATPLGTSQGVHTLYWTGTIAADGKFVPDAHSSAPRLLEMNSREGFGLLSPTVYTHEGKTIALGIVPDKLPSSENWKLGWAHCYSLPREWSLAEDGSLIQKPFEGLKGLRGETMFAKNSFELSGAVDLSPVSGRSVEICGTFEVAASPFGFNVFKSSTGEGKIYYNPASGEIIADFSGVERIKNDNGVYDGIYRCPLPVKPSNGETLKINVFIDHSILDIFINDRWATSIRVFPTEADANGIEAYADSTVKVSELNAWILDTANGNAVESVWSNSTGNSDIYNLQGMRLPSTEGISGIHISNGKKILIRK